MIAANDERSRMNGWRYWWTAGVLGLAALLAGCGGGDDDFKLPTGAEFGLGVEVQLRIGQSGQISAESFAMQFQSVSEDSRCPLGAVCVQAGQATVQLVASRSGVAAQQVALTIPGSLATVSYAGYTVRLTKLEPYPVAGQPTSPSSYVATFVVTR
jgi:hypothetical protein